MKIDTDVLKKRLNEQLFTRLEQAYYVPTDSQHQIQVTAALNTYKTGIELILGIEKLAGKEPANVPRPRTR